MVHSVVFYRMGPVGVEQLGSDLTVIVMTTEQLRTDTILRALNARDALLGVAAVRIAVADVERLALAHRAACSHHDYESSSVCGARLTICLAGSDARCGLGASTRCSRWAVFRRGTHCGRTVASGHSRRALAGVHRAAASGTATGGENHAGRDVAAERRYQQTERTAEEPERAHASKGPGPEKTAHADYGDSRLGQQLELVAAVGGAGSEPSVVSNVEQLANPAALSESRQPR